MSSGWDECFVADVGRYGVAKILAESEIACGKERSEVVDTKTKKVLLVCYG
jgi:hypothetical protein